VFENIEIYPYRRARKGGHKRRAVSVMKGPPKRRLPSGAGAWRLVTPGAAAVGCAGFLLGRAVLLGDLVPFGVAFVAAAVRVFGRLGLVSAPAVIAGTATVSGGVSLSGSILTVVFTLLLLRFVPGDAKRQWLILPGLVFASMVIVKTSLLVFTNSSPYSYFSTLFEALFAALITPVMVKGFAALKRKSGSARAFTGEEIFCILLVLAGMIAGTGDLGYEMISVKGTLSRLAILLAALTGGAGAGAAAGAVLGIIPGLAYTVAPALAPAYSFVGFLGGLCRGFGKAGVATGFLLGSIILSVYLNDYGNLVAVLCETGIATFFFLLVPSFFIEGIMRSAGLESGDAQVPPVDGLVLKEAFEEKMKNWAFILEELSRTFEQVSSAGQGGEEQNIHKLLNKVGEKVCSGCSFYRTCWEREFYKTYQCLIDLLALVEMYGGVSQEHLSGELKKRCTRTKELAITVSCLYETYRVNRYWSSRLLESRGIVSEQLKGIGEVIAGLPDELRFDAETGDAGLNLRKKLKEAGVKIKSFSLSRLRGGGVEVSLSHSCCGGKMRCRDIVAPLLSSALERSFKPAAAGCTVKEGEQVCRLRLCSDLSYRLVLGVSGIGKAGSLVSGDSHAFFHLKGGRLGLALSDGMGAGPRAALESGTTISLLRHLLDLGFGHDLAIKTVNSLLVLRSPGESFATLDLAVVDLFTGQADFIKIGAMPTYLLRGGRVDQIRAGSLPVGIIEDIEITSQARQMEPGDILVMLTDGIFAAYKGAGDYEEWIVKVLEDAAGLPPPEIAELVLKLAQTGAGGISRVPDDMTVVVAALEKQKG